MKNNLVLKCSWVFALVLLGSNAANPACAAEGAMNTNSGTLTIESAIRLALESNPELRASGARINAAAGRAYQSRKWTNPELELNAEDWPVGNHGEFSDAKQTIGISQTLPFPGKKTLDRRIGNSAVKLSEAEFGLRRLEIEREVKIAFYQVLAAERLVEVEGELVRVAESSANVARKRVEAGAAGDQEQLRAEVLLEQARTELSGLEREVDSARQTLANVMGRPDLVEMPLSGELSDTADLKLLEQGPEQWLTNHPSVLAAQRNLDQTDLEFRRAKLEPYPDVKATVSGGRAGETGESIIELGFSVPLPIINWGKGKKQEAEANVSVADAELRAVEQRLLRDWGIARERHRVAATQVTNYRDRILPKADEALRLVQTGFEQGKFGLTDLLDTQRTTSEARRAYQQRLLELNVAQAEIEALQAQSSAPSTHSQTTGRK